MKIPHFIGVEMSCDIFPPLEVKNTSQLCLLSLQTNNSIPNVEPDCNTIGFRNSLGKCINVTIPTGSYEIINLESTIQKLLPNHVTLFQLKADGSTLKCSMTCSHDIDFMIEHSISKILGFENKVYPANTKHESERIVNIMKVNCIKIDCNLISGSFSNAGGYEEDCKITQMQYHSFLPYSTTALSNNDEIRISIQNMDAYTLPSESYLYIEGKLNIPADITAEKGEFNFTNNGLAFLFSEIRYEINGVEIQKLKSPGISSSLKGFCSHTPSELNNLQMLLGT
ncbi:hypothetical protein AGLY_017112 [Aphis glycines]|uniref:Double jelly roll-like domain-containing protein n=1 Tax=Aphis glycines TaxID=307491 RepID=A0A6G0SXN3_APHGL|nr:hypothetical protein AGLY_017112 [Aphis glycines]